MAYTAWSVVYGEQPTAAKWNQLGANDAGFKDGTNIDALAITTSHLANNAATAAKIGYSSIAKDQYANFAPSFSTSSTSYTDMSGVAVTITKGNANSALLVNFATANYTGATGHTTQFGVRAGGTDYDIAKRYHDTLTTFPLGGSRIITGLAAGSQTIQARFRSNTSSTNVIDGNGFVVMTVAEI